MAGIAYFVSLLVGLLLFRLSGPLIGQLRPKRFQFGLLFLLGQRCDFLGGFGKVNVLGFGGVELGLCVASELLATLVANQTPRFLARLQRRSLLPVSIVGCIRFDLFD